MDKNNTCKAYPHLILYVSLNISFLMISILFLCLLSMDYGAIFKIINIVLAILFTVATIIIFFYTTFSGWNAVVRFDNEKAYQKRGSAVIYWYWNDIKEIRCKTNRPQIFGGAFYYPKFKLYAKSHNKVLVFVLNHELMEKFAGLCTNDLIKKQFYQLIKECNFPFPN